jgi:hypothetical protein
MLVRSPALLRKPGPDRRPFPIAAVQQRRDVGIYEFIIGIVLVAVAIGPSMVPLVGARFNLVGMGIFVLFHILYDRLHLFLVANATFHVGEGDDGSIISFPIKWY